jgi:hypothetical protein
MYYVLVLFRKAFEVLLPEGVSFRPEPGSFGHVVVRANALCRARYDENDGVDVGTVGSWVAIGTMARKQLASASSSARLEKKNKPNRRS